MKLRIVLICLYFVLSIVAAHSQVNPADSSSVVADGSSAVSDDFSPGLLFISIIGIIVMLVSIALGITLALLAAAFIAGLVFLGILSTSVLGGFYKRSFTAGFKSFLLISCSLAGILAGMGGLFVINWLIELHISRQSVMLYGAGFGLLGGLFLGQTMFILSQKMAGYVRTRWLRS